MEEEPAREDEDKDYEMAVTIPTLDDVDEELPNEHPSAGSSLMPNSLPSRCGTKIDPWIKVAMSTAGL